MVASLVYLTKMWAYIRLINGEPNDTRTVDVKHIHSIDKNKIKTRYFKVSLPKQDGGFRQCSVRAYAGNYVESYYFYLP